MIDRYKKIRATLAHEIWAAAQLAPGEEVMDGVARIAALLRREGYPAITHCEGCGCDWLDNGLNPVGCPYCELRQEVERRWEGNRRAAQEYVEDMRDVLKEAAQVCRDLDDEALAKGGRLACGAECAAAIADLAARWNVPFERTRTWTLTANSWQRIKTISNDRYEKIRQARVKPASVKQE